MHSYFAGTVICHLTNSFQTHEFKSVCLENLPFSHLKIYFWRQFLKAYIKIKKMSTVEIYVRWVFDQQTPWMLQLMAEKTCEVWETFAVLNIYAKANKTSYYTWAFFSVHRKNVVDPEDPRCARLTLTGQMVTVPPEEMEFAKQAIFSRSVCDMHRV